MVTDEDYRQYAELVFNLWPERVVRYLAGEEKLLGLFVFYVMKASNGRLDPGQAKEVLREMLEERR